MIKAKQNKTKLHFTTLSWTKKKVSRIEHLVFREWVSYRRGLKNVILDHLLLLYQINKYHESTHVQTTTVSAIESM